MLFLIRIGIIIVSDKSPSLSLIFNKVNKHTTQILNEVGLGALAYPLH